MTKRDRLNDSSMLQRRISAKTMKIDVNQGSARRGLAMGHVMFCVLDALLVTTQLSSAG